MTTWHRMWAGGVRTSLLAFERLALQMLRGCFIKGAHRRSEVRCSLSSSSSPRRRPAAAASTSSNKMRPKLLAFDLDATLWVPEMYELHGGAPFRRDKDGRVFDSAGTQIKLMGSAPEILSELATDPAWSETKIAYVSRTEYPEWAIPCLQTILVADGTSMFDISSHREIYPGSKTTHFKRIHKASGIAFKDMIFFDNERWNITDCAPLGITCVYTPQGLTRKAWVEGLQKHAAVAKAEAGEAA